MTESHLEIRNTKVEVTIYKELENHKWKNEEKMIR